MYCIVSSRKNVLRKRREREPILELRPSFISRPANTVNKIFIRIETQRGGWTRGCCRSEKGLYGARKFTFKIVILKDINLILKETPMNLNEFEWEIKMKNRATFLFLLSTF